MTCSPATFEERAPIYAGMSGYDSISSYRNESFIQYLGSTKWAFVTAARRKLVPGIEFGLARPANCPHVRFLAFEWPALNATVALSTEVRLLRISLLASGNG